MLCIYIFNVVTMYLFIIMCLCTLGGYNSRGADYYKEEENISESCKD